MSGSCTNYHFYAYLMAIRGTVGKGFRLEAVYFGLASFQKWMECLFHYKTL